MRAYQVDRAVRHINLHLDDCIHTYLFRKGTDVRLEFVSGRISAQESDRATVGKALEELRGKYV